MNPARLLDSYALLAYLNKKPGFKTVKNLLISARESHDFLLMNEINIGETYYTLYRKRGRIKAEYPIAFPDCFAAVTAKRENAIIITGDPEFKKVEHFIEVEWIQ